MGENVMDKVAYLFILLLSGSSLWANTCTYSGANGLWRSVTWNSCGGTYPHLGDTVTISGGAQVTIPAGEVDVVGTDGAAGTIVLTVTGSASSLILSAGTVPGPTGNGGQLQLHGDISVVNGGNLSRNAASFLCFSTTNGANPAYAMRTATTGNATDIANGTNTASIGWLTAIYSMIDVCPI